MPLQQFRAHGDLTSSALILRWEPADRKADLTDGTSVLWTRTHFGLHRDSLSPADWEAAFWSSSLKRADPSDMRSLLWWTVSGCLANNPEYMVTCQLQLWSSCVALTYRNGDPTDGTSMLRHRTTLVSPLWHLRALPTKRQHLDLPCPPACRKVTLVMVEVWDDGQFLGCHGNSPEPMVTCQLQLCSTCVHLLIAADWLMSSQKFPVIESWVHLMSLQHHYNWYSL